MLPSVNTSQPLVVEALRSMRCPISTNGESTVFRNWVENLNPRLKQACLNAAGKLIGTKAPIFEDGHAILAIAVCSNGLNEEQAAHARQALAPINRWRWVTEEPTSPEA